MECRKCDGQLFLVVKNMYDSKIQSIDLYKCGSCGTKFELTKQYEKIIIIKEFEDEE